MILKVFIETLHNLIHNDHLIRPSNDIFNYIDVVILPVINIDSYYFISSKYGTNEFYNAKYKRKNMNNNYCSKEG